jgi:hypothetical protein
MFKRHAADQRIIPSEMRAFSMAPALTPMTPSDSISADLYYLHHMSDFGREAYDKGREPPPVQYPGPPGFSAVGYMFRRLSLRR